MDQLVSALVAPLVQSMMTQQTPAPIATGGPVDDVDDDKLYGGVFSDYGDPEDYDNDAPDFGGPFESEDIRLQVAPTNYGGPIDAVVGLFTNATSKSIGALGGATKKALGEVAKEVKALKTRDGQQQRQINKIVADVKAAGVRFSRTEMRWAQYFGKKGRWSRAALFVLAKLPGLRSINILSSLQFMAAIEMLLAIGKAADDFTLGAPVLDSVPEVPGADTYTTAGMDAVRDALVSRDAQLASALVAVISYLEDQATAANDVKLKEQMTTLKAICTKDLFLTAASIAPGQLQDREQAIAEGMASYFFGQTRAPGAPLLASGLI